MTWTPYTFYPNPSPDSDSYFYMAFISGYPVFKKVHLHTGNTTYAFRPDALVWFGSEQQIRRFLTV